MEWGTAGWALIALCGVLAAVAIHPAARAAQRYLEQHAAADDAVVSSPAR